MNDIAPAQRLDRVLDRFEQLAIAVSGGVDSVTLAAFAHRKPGLAVTVIHAASPAVPEEATARVRGLSDTEGWTTLVIGTGEFEIHAIGTIPRTAVISARPISTIGYAH